MRFLSASPAPPAFRRATSTASASRHPASATRASGRTATITKAQHCRAEFYVYGFGWVPVDPADVRKVVLEEPPGNLALDDPKVVAARKTLFGGWEGNWLAYNFAHDLALPGRPAESSASSCTRRRRPRRLRLDCLDPDQFKYDDHGERADGLTGEADRSRLFPPANGTMGKRGRAALPRSGGNEDGG